jgi:uncharacterized protein YxeA
MKKIIAFIAQVVISTLASALIVIMFIEWAAGCGESYVDSKGNYHANECVIIK